MQSNILFIALLLYPVSSLLEAWLEVVVIALKDPTLPNYEELNHREHRRSAVYAVCICGIALAIAIALQLYALIPAIALNRRLLFDYPLKLLRRRPFDAYEGDGFFDTIGRWLFGPQGAHIEFLVLILITTASIFYTCH